MTGSRIGPLLGICILAMSNIANAETKAGQALFACYLKAAVDFEPHMDNMLDLAEVLLDSVCFAERQALLAEAGSSSMAAVDGLRNRLRIEVRAMIVSARANRLGMQY